jgi:hypothetical protein
VVPSYAPPKLLLTQWTYSVNSCLDDVDDEVRDRAAFNLKLMQDEPLANTFVRDGAPQVLRSSSGGSRLELMSAWTDSTFSLDALESRLAAYIADTSSAEQPFDLTAVPKVSKEQVLEQARGASPPSPSSDLPRWRWLTFSSHART